MKLPSLFPAKKLRATTARRSLAGPDEMDYEEMSEPNMKLSRALLIVLVLHVVAVAGGFFSLVGELVDFVGGEDAALLEHVGAGFGDAG